MIFFFFFFSLWLLLLKDLSPIFNSQCFSFITEMLEAAIRVDLVSREQNLM